MLGYEIVDQAVTMSYAQDSYDDTQRVLTILKRLTPAIQGRSERHALLELLRDQNPKAFIVGTGSTVALDGLVFVFAAGGRLAAIR